MKVLTWNINSVRLRAGLVQEAIRILAPDVVCLQETKTPDEFFPHEAFESLGFSYRHINGMKGYNGVAILSRIPFENPRVFNRVGREDCRHISVQFPQFELHNLYIPAGGDIPDRLQNEKFGHKLDFVDEVTNWFGKTYRAKDPLVVLGDFNIAPLEHDVWSHKQLLDVVSHTPIETEKLSAFQSGLEWTDAARHFVPENEKCYTWWSYRNRDWKASNRGRRLDHIWVTPPLKKNLASHHVLTEARDWTQTSDHAPVAVNLSW
jgi:exodeoxyribonuclease-3